MGTELSMLPFSLNIGGVRHEVIPSEPCLTVDGILVEVKQRTNGYIYRTLSLANDTDMPSKQITAPYTLDFCVAGINSLHLHTLWGDDCSKNSFMPVDIDIEAGEKVVLAPEGGRSSNTTAFPFFDLTFDGKAMLFAIGWSGQWKCVIERGENCFSVKIGLEHADFYLKPHERVILPSVFFFEGDDAAALRRRFRAIMLDEFNPVGNRGGRNAILPISIQSFDRYFLKTPEWSSTAGQMRVLDGAVKCGYINTLWLDAAWFKDGFPNGVGNFSFANGFPEGLKVISDAVHANGLKFMVWFEPERVVRGSEVYNAHPEFLLSVKGEENTYLYNLGDEKAWKWLYDKLAEMICENGIDNYRHDFNMNPLHYWLENDEEGRTGITEMKYVEGLYKLWDALKAEFPDLFIDNCSSGGRRIDFETMRRAVPMWRSDMSCSPITETAHNDVNNQNEVMCLTEYLPYHAGSAWEPVPNEIRSSRTAGLACEFDVLNPNFDYVRAQKVLEETVRTAAYWDGNFYALTEPTVDENVFAAYQLAKEDCGYAAFFRRADCERDTFRFTLNEIDPGADYIVTETDERLEKKTYTISGMCMLEGIEITIPNKRESLILEYKKIS
jgi:alpha-galactosidase